MLQAQLYHVTNRHRIGVAPFPNIFLQRYTRYICIQIGGRNFNLLPTLMHGEHFYSIKNNYIHLSLIHKPPSYIALNKFNKIFTEFSEVKCTSNSPPPPPSPPLRPLPDLPAPYPGPSNLGYQLYL